MDTAKWSQAAWEAAAPYYKKILELPFIKGIIDGTLPRDRFMFYLQQDELYIRAYSRVLAHIASRVTSVDLTERFLAFASDGVEVEKHMHQSYLKDTPEASEMSPTCLLYTSTLASVANRPVAVEAAAILPCFWVYWAVGQHILEKAGDLSANPYRQWIETYGDPAFTTGNRQAIEACDMLASESTESVRLEMTRMFVLCTRLEWMFWDSAYRQEKWPI